MPEAACVPGVNHSRALGHGLGAAGSEYSTDTKPAYDEVLVTK